MEPSTEKKMNLNTSGLLIPQNGLYNLEQEKLEVPIHGGVSTYEGIGDWKVYVEGTAHETTFGHGEVYLILHSFDGTKSVYKGFGFFKEYSPVTNGSNNFTGRIAGNGALEISES